MLTKKHGASPDSRAGFSENENIDGVDLEREGKHLQALCEIFTESPLQFSEQIGRVLQQGLEIFGLELGIVSKIEDSQYTILFYSPPDAPLHVDQVFNLARTYCALTVENKDVVAIEHMAHSPYSGHPCYSDFGLESYIGVPVIVEGKPYGTLNFSSSVPRLTPFSESDRNFVRIAGRWISELITRKRHSREIHNYQTELEILVEERTVELQEANARLVLEIEENNQAQKNLLKQQSFLNTLIETIPIPVFYKDTGGKYLGCNKAFDKFLQIPRSEIIGKTVYDMGPKDIADKYYQKDKELFDNPGVQHYEWKIVKKDGNHREVIFEKATFRDDQENLAGLVGSIVDITERKQMEKRLLQSQKLEAIGTLSNGIAHDFNNILSGIIGFTELARMKLPSGSPARGDMDKVYSAGKRAIDLVKQILSFSQQSSQPCRPVKVAPIIQEVLKLMKATLPATIELRCSIFEDVTIIADPTQIHQVLVNLCTNSGQSMLEGGVLELTLGCRTIYSETTPKQAELPSGEYLQLCVTDNGYGIPQDIIGRIFDPFFTTKKLGKGSGLGLSVVHGIVKNLGGAIDVTSQPGQGTRVEILVPKADDQESAINDKEETFQMGTEKILFVDDEELIVELGKVLLKRLGYSVTGCISSIKALKIFQERPQYFDLVITDLTMPEMTGEEFARKLVALQPDIPIILCSGLEGYVDEKKAKKLGIVAFVRKPILAKQISKIIREVLDRDKDS